MLIKLSIVFFTVFLIASSSFCAEKSTVAIFDLEASGCSELEAKSITNRLRTELFLIGQFTVLERQMMEEVLSEQGFQLVGCTSSECVVQAGRILGVEMMIAGSLDRLGSLYTINLRLISVESSKIIAVSTVDCWTSIEDVATKSVKEAVGRLVSTNLTETPIFKTDYKNDQNIYGDTEGDKKYRMAMLLMPEDRVRAINLLNEVIDKYSNCSSADDALYQIIINLDYDSLKIKEKLLVLKSYYPNSQKIKETENYISRKEEEKVQSRKNHGNIEYSRAMGFYDTDINSSLEILYDVIKNHLDCDSAANAIYYILTGEEYNNQRAIQRLVMLKKNYPDTYLIKQAEAYINQKEIEIKARKNNEAKELYYLSEKCSNIDSTIYFLNYIVNKYPESDYADDALFDLIKKDRIANTDKHFNRLKNDYPNSEYIQISEDYFLTIKQDNIFKDKYILAVSLERTNLDTAINIMKEILYQSSNDDYIEKALFFLITKSNIKEAEEYLSKLKNLYPESSYLTKAENNYYSRTVLKDDDFVLVKIDSINLYVMKNEVTQEQWKKIMNNNPSFFKGDSLPIENVSWDDVHEYLNKLNRFNVDMIYRLPSEQEWDYFCVANTKTSYFFGDDPAYLINYGWFYDNSSKETHNIRGKYPNDWGIYDLYGNVNEWCEDSFIGNTTFENKYKTNTEERGPIIQKNNPFKVIKGGDYYTKTKIIKFNERNKLTRWDKNRYTGFRLVRTTKQ